MGTSPTLSSKVQSLNSENWIQAGQDRQNLIFSNVNPYRRRLLANIITHQLIQQYELNFITEEDFNSYLSQLSYRQAPALQSRPPSATNFIYPIRYFVNKSKHQMCTTIHTGYLYADKVQLRLKEINDIPFNDLLYIYKATLNGFRLLYEKVGYFDVLEEMIFITRLGEVKVWMNPNLAKNYPNYEKSTYNSNNEATLSQREPQNIYGSQADMIRKLILMIEKNSDQLIQNSQHHIPQTQNELFSEFLEDKNIFDKLSFQHSLDEFQNYLARNNLHCPDFMRSIPQLFSPDSPNPNFTPNYELSHVNEITSQHLTQMKRKFQPMETIVEDENINSKTTHKLLKSYQRGNFQESHVAMYTPPAFSNQRQYNNLDQTQNSKAMRPLNAPFMELNQSRHSHHSNNIAPKEYAHLEKSSKSYTNTQPHINLKPNSGSALNNHKPQQIQQSHTYIGQPQFNHQNPNVIMLQTPHTVKNGNFSHSTQLKPPFANQNSQRIVMISPPPSFRIMNSVNNASFQQVFHHGQPIMLPPPPSFAFFQNSNVSNQGFQQIHRHEKNIIKNIIEPEQKLFSINHNNRNQPIHNISGKILNDQKVFNRSIEKQNKVSSQPKSKSFVKESILSSHKKNEQKSKIKYFTKNDSYQLDEEIANDLEKFLGLKVN